MSDESLKVAEAAFQALSQGLATGDWSSFLGYLADDFTFWFPVGPFKGRNVGKERAKAFFEGVTQVFAEGLHIDVERVAIAGSTVVFEGRSHGKMFGHPYENQAAISFDVREGKICGYREYLSVAYQLGP